MQRRARVGREVVINPSVRGGKRVQKFRTHLVQIFNADLGGARCVWLCHPADQRHTAILCAAEEHSTLESVEVVQVGTRGHAKQAQTAARCPTCGARSMPVFRQTSDEVDGNTGFFGTESTGDLTQCRARRWRTCRGGADRTRREEK